MVSVVICSIDEAKLSRASAMYARLLAGGPFEILTTPNATGLAEAYNRAMPQCSGSCIIFSHDDVELLATDFRTRLLGHMSHCDVLGVVGTTRLAGSKWWSGSGMPYVYGQAGHPSASGGYDVTVWSAPTRRVDRIQAIDGMFLCASRAAAESIRFDEQTFGGFHLYDLDFTFRAHLAGLRCAVANDLFLIHESLGNHGPEWEQDAQRFLAKHAGRIAPALGRHFRSASLHVPDRESVIRVMSPPDWPAESQEDR